MKTNHFIQRKLRADESGFTLIELIVVMIIIAILGLLVLRSGFFARYFAQNTVAQDRVELVREEIKSCAVDNEGQYGSFSTLIGTFCLNGSVVDKKVTIQNLTSTTQSCWDTRNDDNGTATTTTSNSITRGPKYPKVGVCTFSGPGPNGSGASTGDDDATSTYVRISTIRNDKEYFAVEDSQGSHRCTVPLNSTDDTATSAIRCDEH